VKVVFDSNIYVSALAIPGGVAEQALHASMEGAFQLALSQPIIVEVLGVLSRKFARRPEELARTALFLASVAEMVAPTRRVKVLADDPDNRILECAFAAKADLIVTGDHEMLSLGAWEGIGVMSLREFVDGLGHSRSVHQPLSHYGIRPFPKRGSIVTNELVNRLREGDV
jgi:putative PIN family toxin of toxin-antitoxin system